MINLIKHTDYIYEYENFVDKFLCAEIIDKFFKSCEDPNLQINPDLARNKVRYNKSLNLTYYSNYSNNFKKIDDCVHQIFSKAHQNYTTDNKLFYFMIESGYFDNLQSEYFFRYYTPDDYYDWHVDKNGNLDLLLSYMLYLNDDFEGGSTLFLGDRLKVSPKTGSLLCFPCDITMLHKSTKIKKGQKNIIWTCLSRKL